MSQLKEEERNSDDANVGTPAVDQQRRGVHDGLFQNRPNYLFELLRKWYNDAQRELAAKEALLVEANIKHREEISMKNGEISLLHAQIEKADLALKAITRELEEARETIDRFNGCSTKEKSNSDPSTLEVAANMDFTANEKAHLLCSGSSNWATRYNELVAYKQQYGDCNVSRYHAMHKTLGYWVGKMRTEFKNGKLSGERVAKLNELGFVWRIREKKPDAVDWTTRYNELIAYKQQHGDCNVSQYDASYKSLGHWVNKTRTAFKNGKLSDERIAKLNELGFVWEERVGWTGFYNELIAFKEQHGHCNVPRLDESFKRLGFRVHNVRTAFKNGKLSDERVAQLNEIGFIWEPRKHNTSVKLKERYNELVAYKEQHGHCNVSTRDETFKSLGHWVCNTRTSYKNGKLSEECVAKLNELGFVWQMKNDNVVDER